MKNVNVHRRMLARLASDRGKIVPHETLIMAMYGVCDSEPETSLNLIRVYISKLRKAGWNIGTVHSAGYCMAAEDCERAEAELGVIDNRILVPIEMLDSKRRKQK